LRSTALFGASRRIAAMMDVPWQFPAFASRSLQSLRRALVLMALEKAACVALHRAAWIQPEPADMSPNMFG
jgi:hypothetical protein